MFFKFFMFGSFLISISFHQFNADNILLVSTLDGKLTAIDENGIQLWHHEADNEGPLLSQSISKLEFSESGVHYRLIPSLEGVLFRLDSLGLHALPVSADSLIDKSFVLSDDSIAVGSKEQHVRLMDVRRGTLFYQCSGRESCFHGKGNNFADTGVIMVRRQTSSVRALHLRSGQERWNFSVGHLELFYLPCSSSAGRATNPSRRSEKESFEYMKSAAVEHCNDKEGSSTSFGGSVPSKNAQQFQFDISRGQVRTSKWAVHLKSPICKAWELRGQHLHEITVFDMWRAVVPLNTHAPRNQHSSSSTPRIYFGVDKLHEQYYVQTESLDVAAQSKYVNLGIGGRTDQAMARWRSYAISSPTRTSLIYPQLEGKESISTLPNSMSGLALREKVRAAPYPFEEGFYVVGPHVQKKRRPIDSNADKKSPHLMQEEEEEEQDDYPIYIIKYIAGGGNIWHWWPQVLAFAGLTSVTFHLFVVKFIYRRTQCNPLPTFDSNESDSSETLQHASDSSTLKANANDDPHKLSSVMSAPARLQALTTEATPTFVSDYHNRFVHISCLGRGGFGVVFVSRNRMDDIEYAVKRIGVRNSASAKERILREVKALARLEHAGIVRYYQAWIETPPPGWQEEQDAVLLASCRSCEISGNTDHAGLYGSISPDVEQTPPGEPCRRQEASSGGSRWSKISSMNKLDFSTESSADELHLPARVPFRRYVKSSELTDDSFDIVFEDSRTTAKASDSTNSFTAAQDKLKFEVASYAASPDVDTGLSSMGSNSVPPSAPKLYLYIQMQLCQPASLREWLAHNTLNRKHDRMMDIFLQIVNAVDYVHECDLIHRDLKPSNIFFAADNTVRIGDFGLVTPIEDNKAYQQQLEDKKVAVLPPVSQVGDRRHTACVGTELYMSPEQLRGLSYDAKVDMFSLGLIFLELLYPFGTHSERARVLSDARHQILPERFKRELHHEALLTNALLSEEPSLRPTSRALLEHPLLIAAAQQRHSNEMMAKGRSRNASTCSIGKGSL